MIEIMFDNGQCYVKGTDLGAFPTPWAAHQAAQLLAMDEEPNRTLDRDRRMHVQVSNISKANVCDYYGREIPRHVALGLDPKKKYKLLRDPQELAKAAPTFQRMPILAMHVPITAESHQPELVIGTVGSNIYYEHPYLKADTAYWTSGAVNAIHSDDLKELSSAYHYDPDMTPGEYEGEHYDGVMRNLVANHVALVKDGRAGDDVVVGDSKPTFEMEKCMSNKVLSRTGLYAAAALQALMAPALAMDSKPIDTSELFADVTAKNFKDKKPDVSKRLQAALKGEGIKLAQDAKMEDIVGLIDAMEKPEVKEGADADPTTGAPMDMAAIKSAVMDPGANDADEEAEKKRREFLTGKLSPDDMTAYDALCGTAIKPAVDDLPPGIIKNDKEDEMISKPAMDAAIETAVKAEQARNKAITQASIAVRPWVGDLAMAFDSSAQVYGKALEILGVKVVKGTHPDALPAILQAQPKPGAKQAPATLAMDAVPSADFHKRFPQAELIGQA